MVKPGRREPSRARQSLHHPESHAALQPGRTPGGTRCTQAREASEQAGQGPTGASGHRRDRQPLRAGTAGLIPKGARRGWVEGGLKFRKPPKSVLKPNAKSKPDLTRHKVGDLFANL